MSFVYSPKLPLSYDPNFGLAVIRDLKTLIEQNLEALLLTNKGERMMTPDFGVGLRGFLFQQTESGLVSEINEQINRFMPYLTVEDVEIERVEGTIKLYISYSFDSSSELNIFSLSVGDENV